MIKPSVAVCLLKLLSLAQAAKSMSFKITRGQSRGGRLSKSNLYQFFLKPGWRWRRVVDINVVAGTFFCFSFEWTEICGIQKKKKKKNLSAGQIKATLNRLCLTTSLVRKEKEKSLPAFPSTFFSAKLPSQKERGQVWGCRGHWAADSFLCCCCCWCRLKSIQSGASTNGCVEVISKKFFANNPKVQHETG